MVKMIKTKINNKWEIILPEHRANRPEYRNSPYWEAARLDSMHDNLGEGDLIYYVGAEEGEMPALCQMWGATVVMFEPNDKVWPNVKAIWEANNLKPPSFFSGFIGNLDSGIPMLETDFELIKGEVIGDHGFKELHEPGDAPIRKVDTLVYFDKLKPPTAISIDVEGAEFEVLKGAEETLKKYHPKIWLSIHPEFMFRIYGEYQYDLRNWIKDLGYKETILDYQHELHVFYEATL